ncbi:MAG: carbohydrate binding family 9 domain-containing protein [Candidatus Aminicenantes bacterium]|nr:carbohydrate binding family 9 domain-containing protein [Candidatus Aminicenantes bacterium]
MKKILPLTLFLLTIGSVLYPAAVHLQAVKINTGPKIDGLLNDAVWQEALPFSNFKMIDPDVGQKPSEKTELRVLYDEKNLYIGVFCFTSDPAQITVTNLKHDQGERERGNDLVRVLLDPFQDKRNAYVFFVTAGGARTDGLASGEHMSTNWDGIWNAKSKKGKKGWSTEIKIPFKTINFKPGLRAWGFNVERYIPKKMETIRLSGISRDSFFYNPAEAALLEGIRDVKQGNGLTFKPYTSAGTTRDFEAGTEREWPLETGFDLYKNFTPNLVGVITYNTDFAETEVDERRINLTRFPLYYPEKRAFFLEGSEIFSFGSGLHRSFIPFFSRNIGLYDEEQIPVHYGAKVFGKIGNTNIALLDVKTRPFEELGGQNFFAGRLSQNLFAESKAGIIFTGGDPSGAGANHLVGADFTYQTSRFLKKRNFSVGGWWVYNWNTIETGKHYGYGCRIDYPNDLIDTAVSYRYFGDALEPGLAYLPRNGVHSLAYMFQYKPRPQKGLMGKLIRQHRFELFAFFHWDLSGSLESMKIFTAPINFRTESGDHFEFNIIPEKDVLIEEFELSDDFVLPVGSYEFTRYGIQFHSASHRALSLNCKYTFGNYYSGKLNELQAGVSFKYRGNINVGLAGVFIRGDFPQGEFNKNLFRVKTDFFLNSDLGLMSYIQYDDVSREFGANIRLRWRISPGNTLYLVYSRGWERTWDPQSRFTPLYDRGVFKIQLTWRP